MRRSSMNARVKRLLPDESSATVHERGWGALEDGPLLERAEKEFDVLVTIDGSLEYQQNLAKHRIGVVVVHVPKNQLPYYSAVQQELLLAVRAIQAGEVIHVG